ncbi:MAG TPA: cytochrome c3 family protein [Phycisphaerae bacterium]|nr:cytochrome c3 family protein [Phycisphaerae bacterium]HOJ74320.1 cytochrome c3 family protein [Phycisphaerae bacterium]HOM52944.1 cytochrome c3 family protein [Phycisphaerae bacterium]HON67118.1 cytochrome c3 family protein [Phycisphaerae bacterium]HOQ87610.1 cytochrome c3 family protein [Phycisphaerae bacterium]
MAQLFSPGTNSLARITLGAILVAPVPAFWLSYELTRSSYTTRVGEAVEQPVPFSHEHHVSGLGIDCRYCHTSVEESSFAGFPPTKTCMTCHSQIWTNARLLEPVRRSWETGLPLPWVRVHNLPDYVYFDHGIHINKGVGCNVCHGAVERMPLTFKTQTLQMQWCLDCHRQPERYLRPREEVFNFAYQPPADQLALGRRLVEEYGIRTDRLDDCYICHR